MEKLRKFEAKEFWERSDDDPVKAEYWLQNLIRVFKQMECSPDDYLRCTREFKNKYVRKSNLDKKKRKFLDLRQRNQSVAEYEREFVYLSKYARDIVPTEEEMCIRFEEGLNDETRMLIGGIVIQEFFVLSDRAQKMEEVYNRKMQRERRFKESYKRSSSKSFSTFPAKRFRDDSGRTSLNPERSNRNRATQQEFGVTIKPAASVSSVQNVSRSKCKYC
ncbi:uncharacterized protein LOC108485011 [Gossypium arboreum]|uniref:uncharacterized protein LOC108485011 n=1 Tax=Gossypium arboreum TaxID=29729 RepID=UPI0008196E18|nr:uncharacterized protein LOC108485011 [Gossypium arboreum]